VFNGPVGTLSGAKASALFADWSHGLGDATPVPLIVVDLDDDAGAAALALPDNWPGVVVGIGTPGPSRGLTGVDVALTTAVNPPAPWVTAPDMAEMIDVIAATGAACPLAATAYVQVLRAGEGLSVGQGLLLESVGYSTLQAGPEFRSWLTSRAPLRPVIDTEPVLVSRQGKQLFIALNRPEVHNAYSAAVREALCDALAIALSDPGVEEVVLSGVGPSFCSGGDLAEFGTAADPASAHLIRFGRSPGRLLAVLSRRVSALVHGFCVGSGIELPAFAAMIEAHPDTRFQLPELSMGLIPGAGGTVSLPRRIGRHRTAWLGLTGRRVGTALALDWGLIDRISPRSQ
jgi:enoyl-CoA hydratase/carnithine racemase